jgi:hypothetical protein
MSCIVDCIYLELAAHLLGKDLISGLNIQVNFLLSWQQRLRVWWQGFALHAKKKRATILARSLTLYSFFFEDMVKYLLLRERKWVT